MKRGPTFNFDTQANNIICKSIRLNYLFGLGGYYASITISQLASAFKQKKTYDIVTLLHNTATGTLILRSIDIAVINAQNCIMPARLKSKQIASVLV